MGDTAPSLETARFPPMFFQWSGNGRGHRPFEVTNTDQRNGIGSEPGIGPLFREKSGANPMRNGIGKRRDRCFPNRIAVLNHQLNRRLRELVLRD